ncbi:MAG: hypothetical protein KDA74_07740, partial [Planctomycetaceae bacterium]|nr:hypothetical protein [Planctomycetaceae bacterium]
MPTAANDQISDTEQSLTEKKVKPMIMNTESETEQVSRRKKRWLRRFPHVRQLDETDCGAACLSMISRFYGVRLSIGELRDLACVGQDGASLNSLSRAAEQMGFSTRLLRTGLEGLRSLELPLIAHWQGIHFVVVYQLTRKYVLVADPARGLIK